jgi:hypothetical protein
MGNGYLLEQWQYGYEGRVVALAVLEGNSVRALARSRPTPTVTAHFEGCGPMPGSRGPIIFAPDLPWDVHDSLVAFAAEAGYVVRVANLEGRVFRSVRRGVRARPATRADAEHWAREHPIRVTSGAGECRIRPGEMVDKMGFADSLPSISGIRLAPDGTLWVQRWTVGDEPGPVDVFDASGEYLGTLPEGVPFPLEFTPGGHVLVAERDELDIERLVVAELIRP